MLQLKKDWYTIGEAAKMLGVSPDTLRRWEKQKKITSFRTAGNRRRYSKETLISMLFYSAPFKKPSGMNTKNTQKKTPPFQAKTLKILYLMIAANFFFVGIILFLIFFIIIKN